MTISASGTYTIGPGEDYNTVSLFEADLPADIGSLHIIGKLTVQQNGKINVPTIISNSDGLLEYTVEDINTGMNNTIILDTPGGTDTCIVGHRCNIKITGIYFKRLSLTNQFSTVYSNARTISIYNCVWDLSTSIDTTIYNWDITFNTTNAPNVRFEAYNNILITSDILDGGYGGINLNCSNVSTGTWDDNIFIENNSIFPRTDANINGVRITTVQAGQTYDLKNIIVHPLSAPSATDNFRIAAGATISLTNCGYPNNVSGTSVILNRVITVDGDFTSVDPGNAFFARIDDDSNLYAVGTIDKLQDNEKDIINFFWSAVPSIGAFSGITARDPVLTVDLKDPVKKNTLIEIEISEILIGFVGHTGDIYKKINYFQDEFILKNGDKFTVFKKLLRLEIDGVKYNSTNDINGITDLSWYQDLDSEILYLQIGSGQNPGIRTVKGYFKLYFSINGIILTLENVLSNQVSFLDYVEQASSPGTPPADHIYTYADTSSIWHMLDAAGTDIELGVTSRFVRMGIGTAADSTDIVKILQASTVNGSAGLDISHTGAISGTGYGAKFSKTGAGTTNVAGYFSASGATNNYGLIVAAGFTGLGTLAPEANLHVMAADAGVAPSGSADVAVFEFTAGAGVDGISLLYPDNRSGIIAFGTPNDNLAGRIVYSGPTVGTVVNRDSMQFTTNSVEAMRLDVSGNMGIGLSAFGTSAAKVIGIANGTSPSTQPADMIQIGSKDSSDSKATLDLNTEQAVEAIGTFTASHKQKIYINGTEYWIQLDAV